MAENVIWMDIRQTLRVEVLVVSVEHIFNGRLFARRSYKTALGLSWAYC